MLNYSKYIWVVYKLWLRYFLGNAVYMNRAGHQSSSGIHIPVKRQRDPPCML